MRNQLPVGQAAGDDAGSSRLSELVRAGLVTTRTPWPGPGTPRTSPAGVRTGTRRGYRRRVDAFATRRGTAAGGRRRRDLCAPFDAMLWGPILRSAAEIRRSALAGAASSRDRRHRDRLRRWRRGRPPMTIRWARPPRASSRSAPNCPPCVRSGRPRRCRPLPNCTPRCGAGHARRCSDAPAQAPAGPASHRGPPPVDVVAPRLSDLARRLNAADRPGSVVAAVVHAELMTLQPFTYGSGLVTARWTAVLGSGVSTPTTGPAPEVGSHAKAPVRYAGLFARTAPVTWPGGSTSLAARWPRYPGLRPSWWAERRWVCPPSALRRSGAIGLLPVHAPGAVPRNGESCVGVTVRELSNAARGHRGRHPAGPGSSSRAVR